MFRRVKLRNFSTSSEKYQIMLLNYARRIIDKKTLGACFEEINSLAEKLSESNDLGLRFLASELKLLISESELLRFSLVEQQQEGAFTQDVIESKGKIFSELPGLYAFPDLPMAHDVIAKFYVQLYKAVLPKVNVPDHKLAQELAAASESLRAQPPRLRDFYEVIRKYNHRVINENPDLTFSFNYISQLFFEALYLKRAYLTREEYLNICKTFGEFLEKIAKAIKKHNRIDLYNNLYDLYSAITKLAQNR